MSGRDTPGLWRATGRIIAWPATTYARALRHAANTDAIRDEAANIRRLAAHLRSAPPAQGVALVTDPEGRIDVPLTAEVAGLPREAVERMLALQMRRTATTFWTCLAVAGLGLAAWVAAALWLAPGRTSALSGLLTALLVLTLGARAGLAALRNWQIRRLRFAPAAEFLAAEDWMPRARRTPGA